jgi:hypothetical protein
MDYSRKWIAEYCIGQFPDKVGDMMIRMWQVIMSRLDVFRFDR